MSKPTPMAVTPIRLPPALLRRLDHYAVRLRREHPGARFTRSDAIRLLLERALADVEEVGHGRA
jgi:predicted transcriptional regulator